MTTAHAITPADSGAQVRPAVPYRNPQAIPLRLMQTLSSLGSTVAPISLRSRRERAERIMNALRAGVLVLLAGAAVVYAPQLAPSLDRMNAILLVPAIAWTFGQYVIWYGRPHLPAWLPLTNAIVDVTAVTGILAAYSISGSGNMALRTPIFMMYFVVLAARPVASSVRKTAVVASLVVIEYTILFAVLLATHSIDPMLSPVEAVRVGRLSYLDEGAKILILIIAGAVAVYATSWVEGLVIESINESSERQKVETRLAKAQLDTLRLQLSPHFLFNALNGAMALIGRDSRAAEKMVASISEFLRMILRSSAETKVTIERELSLMQRYIDIQRVRFGEKLSVNFDIDESLSSALVPSLLLQPLVENAIRHGISPRASGGTIGVSIRKVEGALSIHVTDDGVGPAYRKSRARQRGTGLGLANTATRLNHLYGQQYTFDTERPEDGGFGVHITLPLEYDSTAKGDLAEELKEIDA